MKKILCMLLLGVFIFSACEKVELSKTELISKTWVFEEIVHTSTKQGVVTTNNQSVTNSDYEQEFKADGTFIIRNDGVSIPGTWTFVNNHTLHTKFDSNPQTIYSSVITNLTVDQFWITNTSSSVDSTGTTIVTVSEIKHTAK